MDRNVKDPRWRVNLAEEVEVTVNYMRSSKGRAIYMCGPYRYTAAYVQEKPNTRPAFCKAGL